MSERAIDQLQSATVRNLSAPRPMLPILTFKRRPLDPAPGEIVLLGAEPIGEIFGGVGDYFAWRVDLHGVRSAFQRAESMSRARDAIERAVNDWLNRIGVFYPGLGVELRIEDE